MSKSKVIGRRLSKVGISIGVLLAASISFANNNKSPAPAADKHEMTKAEKEQLYQKGKLDAATRDKLNSKQFVSVSSSLSSIYAISNDETLAKSRRGPIVSLKGIQISAAKEKVTVEGLGYGTDELKSYVHYRLYTYSQSAQSLSLLNDCHEKAKLGIAGTHVFSIRVSKLPRHSALFTQGELLHAWGWEWFLAKFYSGKHSKKDLTPLGKFLKQLDETYVARHYIGVNLDSYPVVCEATPAR